MIVHNYIVIDAFEFAPIHDFWSNLPKQIDRFG